MSQILDHSSVLNLLPDREADTHKGNYGKILLLCGSRGYTGAAYLSAMGALRVGSGLVFLGVPESIYSIEAIKLNEAIVFPLPDYNGMLCEAAIGAIKEKLPQMDAVLIGCGLGKSSGTYAVVKWILENAKCPVVVDADGINVLTENISILKKRESITILTPHDGEFIRLGGTVLDNRVEAAQIMAKRLDSIMVLKGHRTCITNGIETFLNTTGNPGMAVGGSGDLLAGMITGLLGQHLNPMKAAAAACWLHGKAGDMAAAELGQYAMLPSDMLTYLPKLMK